MIRPVKTFISVGGRKGDDPPPPYVPVEEANSLRANTIVRIVDVLTEGEISAWGVGDDIYKSTYLNETPVKAADDTMNFDGVTLVGRKGTATQDYLPGFDEIESENTPAVNTQVTNAGGAVSRTISDTTVDDVRITMSFPRMVNQESDGDLRKISVQYHITVTPDSGAGTEQTVFTKTLTGKCMSEYRRSHRITNISQYGTGPWVVKVYRDTADSGSSKKLHDTYWYNFTNIWNVKLRYPNTVCVGLTFDLQLFGGRIPSRKYRLNGRLINYPSNYTPSTRTYSGVWDGTFTSGYCTNPAWVVYDMLVNDRFGVGAYLNWVSLDKWTLYTIAQYCDGDVTYTSRTRAADGTYSDSSETLPRFTFNGVIQNRVQALALITHMCSAFRGYPIWSTGMVSFVQDAPKTATRLACPANVKDGLFEYEGSDGDARTTVVKVSYTDMDNFGRPKLVNVVDQEGVARYGHNPIDLTAFGCNNPLEATLRGKYQNYTNLNQTDKVGFGGTIEWADAIPGEVTEVQDPEYADVNQSGRILSSTTESITIDREIEIETGVTYTLLMQSATENSAHEVTLNNTVTAATNVLTWSGAISPAPSAGMVWVVSSTATTTREFEVLHVGDETEDGIPIRAIEYDSNKYTEIETGIVIETDPEMALTVGKMAAPSGLSIQPYPYTESDHQVRKYGMLISWDAADDTRVLGYEVIGSYNGGGWFMIEQFVPELSADYRDVLAGTYDIGVRAVGVSGKSNYVYFEDFVMGADVDAPAPPTGLQCVDDPASDYFTGPDCEIEWTASIGSNYTVPADAGNDIPFEGAQDVGVSNVVGYKIEVYDGTTLVRTHYTVGQDVLSWSYTLAMNSEDNGSPIRNINFRVYTVDVSGTPSLTYASLSASNPAPTMASQTPTILDMAAHLDISWTVVADNDMDYYQVKVDGSEVDRIPHPGNSCRFHDVEVGTNYTVQIVPFDQFGEGTGSNTDTGSPIVIPAINLEVELSGSLEMSDSDSNTAATLAKLYDGVTGSNGVSYTLSGADKYIQYKYGLEDYFDRIGIWTADANGRAYVALSDDGSSWTFYKADTDHTVDSTGTLTEATNQADAQTNYWQLASGENLALLPNNLVAKYVRLYLTGTYSTTIYELIPARILISEMAAIRNLSTLTADLGVITAGVAKSSDGTFYIDFDGKRLMVFDDALTITTGENDKIDWIENSTTYAATLTAGTTYTPTTLAAHVQTIMRAAGDNDTTVTYNSTTRKITIANSTLTTFELLWDSGTNADTSCGKVLGFDVANDDDGALTYTADLECGLRVKLGDLS